jgi:hypothetical protein
MAKATRLRDFTGHQQAEFFEADAIGGQFPDQAALIDHEDAIAESEKLFELSRNQKDRLIEIALFQYRPASRAGPRQRRCLASTD